MTQLQPLPKQARTIGSSNNTSQTSNETNMQAPAKPHSELLFSGNTNSAGSQSPDLTSTYGEAQTYSVPLDDNTREKLSNTTFSP